MTTSNTVEHAQTHASEALRAMPSELRASCEEVRQLLTEARRAGSSARYRIGRIVQEIVGNEAKYGTSGVKVLARAVGRSHDTLYGYAVVARRWRETEFTALSTRRGIHGVPLTFAHFVVLARIAAAERRSTMVERSLREGLSVRDLRRLTEKSKRSPNETVAQEPTLRRALAASGALFDAIGPIDQLVKDVRSKPITPKLAEQLEALVRKYRELRDTCSSNGEAMDVELRRVRETLEARGNSARRLAS